MHVTLFSHLHIFLTFLAAIGVSSHCFATLLQGWGFTLFHSYLNLGRSHFFNLFYTFCCR